MTVTQLAVANFCKVFHWEQVK